MEYYDRAGIRYTYGAPRPPRPYLCLNCFRAGEATYNFASRAEHFEHYKRCKRCEKWVDRGPPGGPGFPTRRWSMSVDATARTGGIRKYWEGKKRRGSSP